MWKQPRYCKALQGCKHTVPLRKRAILLTQFGCSGKGADKENALNRGRLQRMNDRIRKKGTERPNKQAAGPAPGVMQGKARCNMKVARSCPWLKPGRMGWWEEQWPANKVCNCGRDTGDRPLDCLWSWRSVKTPRYNPCKLCLRGRRYIIGLNDWLASYTCQTFSPAATRPTTARPIYERQ
jgi:hypothetical protein